MRIRAELPESIARQLREFASEPETTKAEKSYN
jgi:hypothetical protein